MSGDWRPAIGTRVVLRGDHPWAGHSGVVVEHEIYRVLQKKGAIVELDNGFRVGLLDPSQYTKAAR